jgi:hypothetical protein
VKKTSRPTAASRPRSRAPRPQPALVAVLGALADVARRLELRWYVFGAQAVSLHGFPRATADLDVTVELAQVTPRQLVAALDRAGFAARFADDDFVARTRVIPLVHRATSFPIDVVIAGPGLEQQFLDEVELRTVGRRRVPVLSIENLIVTKLLAGRPKDLEDIRELVASAGDRVDHARIDALLALLEDALDQRDLRPLYRRLRAESRR